MPILSKSAVELPGRTTDQDIYHEYLFDCFLQTEEIVDESDTLDYLTEIVGDCAKHMYAREPLMSCEDDAVEAAINGFMSGIALTWELEPNVKPAQLIDASEKFTPVIESLNEVFEIGTSHENVFDQILKYSKSGIAGVDKIGVVIDETIEALEYEPDDIEMKYFRLWAGIGAFVFLEAWKENYQSRVARVLDDDNLYIRITES
jgi:hypothetical protein